MQEEKGQQQRQKQEERERRQRQMQEEREQREQWKHSERSRKKKATKAGGKKTTSILIFLGFVYMLVKVPDLVFIFMCPPLVAIGFCSSQELFSGITFSGHDRDQAGAKGKEGTYTASRCERGQGTYEGRMSVRSGEGRMREQSISQGPSRSFVLVKARVHQKTNKPAMMVPQALLWE